MSLPLAPFGPRTGLRGMVAAADQLAASAGLGMLEQGGSAADAAVATGTAMAVVGPHLCGLGGDVLAMVAPPGGRRPRRSSPSAGPVPGPTPTACAATAWRRCRCGATSAACRCPAPSTAGSPCTSATGGCRSRDVLAPAIELAEEGFPGLHHAGAGQPSRPRPPRRRRAVPRRPARHRPDRAPARHRPHAARHRPRRPRRLLRGRVRAGPARARRRPLRAGRLRHQRGVVVHAAARRRPGATTCGPCRPRRRAT